MYFCDYLQHYVLEDQTMSDTVFFPFHAFCVTLCLNISKLQTSLKRAPWTKTFQSFKCINQCSKVTSKVDKGVGNEDGLKFLTAVI